MQSEVAHFRNQQAVQEQTARQGLHGYAQVSRHGFIEARMERGAERLLHRIQEGRHEEAKALFSTEEWW